MTKVSKSFPELLRSRARSRARGLARDEGGAVAVLFALMLGALIGMMALAVDLGKAWNLETELQHAADACALAGVTQLDASDGARARAIDACINKVALPLVENNQRFASDGLGADVTFNTSTAIDGDGKTLNPDIKFYTSLPISAAVEATSDAEATYVEATVAPRRVDFSFAMVVGAVSSTNPTARAVAGWTSFFCDSPPMFMCNPAEPAGGDKSAPFYIDSSCPDYGDGQSCVGRTLAMKTHAGGSNQQLGPGDWGYLSLTVFDEKTGETKEVSGEKELGEALASVVYDNVCTGNQLSTKPGNMTALDRMINTRFDIYAKSAERMDPNRQPARQALKGLIPNPDDGDWDPANGCKFNPANLNDAGGQWWRPQDVYGGGGFDPVTGQPIAVQDTFRDTYLGPGRHTKVDVLDNVTMATPPDGMADPFLAYNAGPGTTLGLVDPPIRTMAFPNDHCAYLTADVDASVSASVKGGLEGCRPAEGGLHMGTGQWDRQTYLDVYQPDLEVSDLLCDADFSDITSTCADLPNVPGEVPDGKLSRWEVYNWEKRADASAAMIEYPNMPQKGKPRCYKGPDQVMGDTIDGYVLPEAPAIATTLDRRIIVMAVVNCVGWDVKGKTDMGRAPGDSHIGIFLTEPMGLTEADSLNGEVVDPRGLGIGEIEVQPQLIRERILLLE
jgi:Flp pilus assembly protein TadG